MAMILLCEKVPAAWSEALGGFLRGRQPEGLTLELAQLDDADPAKSDHLLGEATVLVSGLVGPGGELGRETFAKAPELRLVQRVGSRLVGIDIQAAREVSVQVSLLPAPAHVGCAEHTMLLILALARKLLPAHQRVVKRSSREGGPEPRAAAPGSYAYNWANLQGVGVLAGKTLGLVGMGDIAVEVARRARAFGMRLLYHDKEPLPADEERELGVERCELDAMLAEADIVSLHVGLCPETEKLINAERLAKMKPTALLVNTARGGLVDEEALCDALSNGRLGGAALDAWAVEPTPRDNPLLKLENVVATPHVAAGTLSRTALFEAILPNIVAALKGQAVAGSLTPGLEPKPAVPVEAPPPAPAAPSEAPAAAEAPPPESAPPSQESAAEEKTPPAEEEAPEQGEATAADASLDDEDTPPTLVAGPAP